MLHLASLFDEEPLPPVVCFSMGTLGFLTPFDVADFRWGEMCVCVCVWVGVGGLPA